MLSTTPEPPVSVSAWFIVGNAAVAVFLLFYVMGRCYALPFKQPMLGSFMLFCTLFYFMFELWRVPGSPIATKLPQWMRFLQFTYINEVEFVFIWICVVATVPLYRHLNERRFEELGPLRQSMQRKKMQQDKGDTMGHRRSLRTKKREALARELAIAVEHLAFTSATHPVILLLFRRRKIRHLRDAVGRLLKVSQRWSMLDFALVRVNAPLLLAFCDKKSVELLRAETPQLSREAKAVLLDALQKNAAMLRSDVSRQEWVKELLVSTTGGDLMVMRNILDGGGDYHSLRKLLFEDIQSAEHRADILTHFANEAGDLPRPSEGLEAGARPAESAIILKKVLSDIDDTLYSSGGHFPAGCDKRFPKHAVYPGLLQLYMELDTQWKMNKILPKHLLAGKRGSASQDFELEHTPCNLVFLSARPHIYKDISERVSYRLFKHLLREGRLHAMPTLIPGRFRSSIGSGLKACFRLPNAWWAVGVQKYESICEFCKLYPSYSLIFFGDNGQGDVLAAELARGRSLVHVAFIHEVQPRNLSVTSFGDLTAEERDAKWKELDIIWVKSPVEAAVRAAERGLISPEALFKVCESAVEDLEALAIRSPQFPQWKERFVELNAALTEARSVREDIGMLDAEALEAEMKALVTGKQFDGSQYSDQLSASLLEP